MNGLKSERGITLIALIITIIILVILAAISINAVYNNGIIEYAINGTQNYAQKAVEENRMYARVESKIEEGLIKQQIKDYRIEVISDYIENEDEEKCASLLCVYTDNTNVAFTYNDEYLLDITDSHYKCNGISFDRIYGIEIAGVITEIDEDDIEEVAYDEENVKVLIYDGDLNENGRVQTAEGNWVSQFINDGISIYPTRGQRAYLKADVNKNKKLDNEDPQIIYNIVNG